MDKLIINKIRTNNYLNNRTNIHQSNTINFSQVLEKVSLNNTELRFSKHAIERLSERHISLTNNQMSKLSNAVDKARGKGVNEALILMGDTAFIASIKNNTIITTASKDQLKENVFTNIDGAVII